jgi:hypothetical protein
MVLLRIKKKPLLKLETLDLVQRKMKSTLFTMHATVS